MPTKDDVERFFTTNRKLLPTPPEWRDAQRAGERRFYLPIEADGIISPIQLTSTIYLNNPDYLVIQLSAPPPICRLCMTGLHRDRVTGRNTIGAHYHPWERNKPKGQRLMDSLSILDDTQPGIMGRDEAFAWFLQRNGIESPAWGAVEWPLDQGLF